MEMYIWDSYAKDQIPDALVYWVDYWQEKAPLFGHTDYGAIFESPATLLKLIQDEVDFNGLQSKEMREYFSNRVKFYLENHYLLDSDSFAYFKILFHAIPSGTTDLIYGTCSEFEKRLSNGNYIKNLVANLKDSILVEGDLKKIRNLTNCLIVEFYMAGYGIEYIKKVPKCLFSSYVQLAPKVMTTDFPHTIDFEPFNKSNIDEIDYDEFHSLVRAEMDKLTVEDRLYALSRLYFKEEEELTYIFQLKGAKGEVGSIYVGDVHIYSPNVHKYIIHNPIRESDAFANYEDLGVTPANVAVKYKTRDPESTRSHAIAKIREALNLLHLYLPSGTELSIESISCHTVDDTGRARWTSSHANQRSDQWFWTSEKSIEIEDMKIGIRNGRDNFREFFRINESHKLSAYSHEQIKHALHFLDKARKSETAEDRLVNLWVCLEKIFSERKTLFSLNRPKVEAIFDLLPSVIMNRFYDRAWSSFYFLNSLYNSSQGQRRLLPVDDELAKEVHFKSHKGNIINITNFLNNLDRLLACTDREIIKEKIIETKNFYFDNKKSIKLLKEDEAIIKSDLLLIYRMRNKIVHDAHFDNVSIKIWADRLESYVRCVVASALSNHCKNNEKIHDYLVRTKVDYLHVLNTLGFDRSKNLIDFSFRSHTQDEED